ncbi:DUF4231 domain-containing protein [Parvularcula lutaonensis]|uniref:DUF4231 domain-containing protein n=1 Tax=Parvularcula lutaonensis TaxID=491923 RepID=A0ABV7MFC4_9PROT|nr:DUF4231 domain-containing protein [Parvularcula lutaonensis]GGY53934.1 hypothetical protein GCM10007148_24170 [Parvularcula lutaonensis]
MGNKPRKGLVTPPRARLCLRVGVTGHRALEPDQRERITRQVDEVLSACTLAAQTAKAKSDGWVVDEPPLLRLVSPLAAGADTLAAERATSLGWSLQAVTPFPVKEYCSDFSVDERPVFDTMLEKADAVLQLDGERDTREHEASAYLAGGQVVLDQCDVLLAIWNGKAARGIGGTAMIIEIALARGVPVIWVHSEDDKPVSFVAQDFSSEGSISDVESIVTSLLVPPDVDGGVLDFYGEKEKRGNYGLLFDLFEFVVAGRKIRNLRFRMPPYVKRVEEEWRPYLEGLANIGGTKLAAPAVNTLMPRYGWADGLATYYGSLYRSSYVANYLLSGLAVGLALAEIVVGFGKEVFIALETVVILAIAAITIRGRKSRWHEKWIDYRQLAEQLRHARFLYLTGASLGAVSQRHDYGSAPAGSWVEWYNKMSLRELGLPAAVSDRNYISKVRQLFMETELENQLAYHEANAHRMEHLEHRLHKVGDSLFLLTLVTCLVFLGSHAAYEWGGLKQAKTFKYAIKGWVTVLTALLPAIGAAMLGIRVQGEFGSTAERSEATAERLEEIARDLEEKEAISFSSLRSYVEASAETMLVEVVDWRFVYRGKPISLPA